MVNLFLGIIVDTLVSDYEENIIIEDELNAEENLNNLTLRNIERLAKLHQKAEKKGIKNTLKKGIKKSNLKATKEQLDKETNKTFLNDDYIYTDVMIPLPIYGYCLKVLIYSYLKHPTNNTLHPIHSYKS